MNKKGFTLIEILGVIILLGIILGIAVVSYSSYLSKSKDRTFKIEEQSFLSATKGAYLDCESNKKNSDLCKKLINLNDEYMYDLVYLQELIDNSYIEAIKNPYNTDLFCDASNSYVYLGNRTINGDINKDIMYNVCLICGDHRSKTCLNEDLDYATFITTCSVHYDSPTGELYKGEWTDRNLYLNFGVSGDYKYGISQFVYNGIKVKPRANETTYSVLLNKDIKDVQYKVYALDGASGKGTEVICGGNNIKIDKANIDSVTLTAKTVTTNTIVKDGEWSSEAVILTATPTPVTSTSGYIYQWYKDGVKYGDLTSSNILQASNNGTYYVEITNGVGKQTKSSNEFTLKMDLKDPTCTLVADGTKYSDTNIYISNVNISFSETADLEEDGTNGSGIKSQSINISTLTDNFKDKEIIGTVTDKVGRVGYCSIKVTKDDTIPTVTAKQEINYIYLDDDNNLIDFFDITYGVSGGTTECNVNDKKVSTTKDLEVGINEVTCVATGNNGKTSNPSKTILKHQYEATASCSDTKYSLNDTNTSCSNRVQTGTETKTTYSCPNGGTLSSDKSKCITVSASSYPGTLTCSLYKSCTYTTAYYTCNVGGKVCFSTTQVGDVKTQLESHVGANCQTPCYGTGGGYRGSVEVKTGRNSVCGTESVTGSDCANASSKKCSCPNGGTCNSSDTCVISEQSYPSTSTTTSTPVYSTNYIKPTYSCDISGTDTISSESINPVQETITWANNKYNKVPLCQF